MDGGNKQALFLNHLRDRATEALATTKGRFWLAACPSTRHIKPCGREDANCWRVIDESAHLPCSSFKFMGVIPAGGHEYSIVLGTLCDPKEMQEFASFAKEAGAMFIASPPPGVSVCGPPAKIWAGALMFWRPCAEQAVKTQSDCFVVGQPWAVSLAAIRAWGELIPQPPTVASLTADEIALKVAEFVRSAEDGSIPRKKDFVFAPSGDGYFIRAFGAEGHFSGLTGFRDLHLLVCSPRKRIPWVRFASNLIASDVRKVCDESDRLASELSEGEINPQEIFDGRGLAEIIKERQRFQLELDSCEDWEEADRNELTKKIDDISKSLDADSKRSGKSRDFQTQIDRCRAAICNRIRLARNKLNSSSSGMSALADHFEAFVKSTPEGMIYSPPPDFLWNSGP